MSNFSELKGDIAKGVLSAIALLMAVNTQAKLDTTLTYGSYFVLLAFIVWMGFLVRATRQRQREFQYMGFWGCWKRPIIALVAFALPLAFFLR